MLRVEGIDLHYGASQALWRVSLTAAVGEITCVLGRNGVGKTSTLRAVVRPGPAVGRQDRVGRARTSPACRTVERARRGIALVPQGREIFPLLTVEENLQTGFGAAAARRAARARAHLRAVPGPEDHAPAPRRRPLRRPAAAAGDRPRPGHAARSSWCSTSRPRASSPRSSRTSAACSSCCAARARWPSCWSSSISTSPRRWPTGWRSWTAGQVVLAGRPDELDDADVRRYLTV